MAHDDSNDLLQAALERARSMAVGWLNVTQPNTEIDRFDLDEIRGIAEEIIALSADDAFVLTESLESVLARLPDIKVNYEDDAREAIIIKARLSDLTTAIFATLGAARSEQETDEVVVTISSQLRDQLKGAVADELREAKRDLTAIRASIDRSSGISLSVGPVSVELDALSTAINGALSDLATGVGLNLEAILVRLTTARDRARELLKLAEAGRATLGEKLLELFRRVAEATGRALVAGLEAIQAALGGETEDPTREDERDPARGDDTRHPIAGLGQPGDVVDVFGQRVRNVIADDTRLADWLRLTGALERASRAHLTDSARAGTNRAHALLAAGHITQAECNAITSVLSFLQQAIEGTAPQRRLLEPSPSKVLALAKRLEDVSRVVREANPPNE